MNIELFVSKSSTVSRPTKSSSDEHSAPSVEHHRPDQVERNLITFSSSKSDAYSSSFSLSSRELDESDSCVEQINEIMPGISKHQADSVKDSLPIAAVTPTTMVTPPSSPPDRAAVTNRNRLTNILNELKYKSELKSAIRDLLEERFTLSYEKVVSQADRDGRRELVDKATDYYDKLKEQFVEYGNTFDTVEDLENVIKIVDAGIDQDTTAAAAPVTPVIENNELPVENESVLAESNANQAAEMMVTDNEVDTAVGSQRPNIPPRPNVIRLNGERRSNRSTNEHNRQCEHRR